MLRLLSSLSRGCWPALRARCAQCSEGVLCAVCCVMCSRVWYVLCGFGRITCVCLDLHGASSLLHVEALHWMRYQLGWTVFGPGAGHLLVLGAWRVVLVRQCLRLPAVGFAQLNRVWSASTIALPSFKQKKKLGWSVRQTLHLVAPALMESPTRNSRAAAFYRVNVVAPVAWCALSAMVAPHTLPSKKVVFAWTSPAKFYAELSLCAKPGSRYCLRVQILCCWHVHFAPA
jgi:hypothetical protein